MSLNENHVVLLPNWLLLHQQQHHKLHRISGRVVVVLVVVLVRHEKEIVLTTGSNAMNDVAHHLQHSNSTCTPNFPIFWLHFFCFMSFTTTATTTTSIAADVLLLHIIYMYFWLWALLWFFASFCSPLQWQILLWNGRKEGIEREKFKLLPVPVFIQVLHSFHYFSHYFVQKSSSFPFIFLKII